MCCVGVSIGHRDTDNLITRNTVQNSREAAVLFRPENGPSFAGHRNRIESNRFIDNAPAGGAVIDIQGGTESITIRSNTFTESRSGAARIAVKQGPETKDIAVDDNRAWVR